LTKGYSYEYSVPIFVVLDANMHSEFYLPFKAGNVHVLREEAICAPLHCVFHFIRMVERIKCSSIVVPVMYVMVFFFWYNFAEVLHTLKEKKKTLIKAIACCTSMQTAKI
jgi:hypothetical protein